jgi:hypothetical protein
MKNVIKLTSPEGEKFLLGVDSIIDIRKFDSVNPKLQGMSKIQCRGAMVTTNWATESIDEIYDLINQ